MNKQQQDELLKTLQQISTLAGDIHQMAKGINDRKIGPWTRWYAWYPVTTIGNQRVWGKSIYRRTRYTIFKRYAGRDYATDFDLLKENE